VARYGIIIATMLCAGESKRLRDGRIPAGTREPANDRDVLQRQFCQWRGLSPRIVQPHVLDAQFCGLRSAPGSAY
jgi:hypothetical protein